MSLSPLRSSRAKRSSIRKVLRDVKMQSLHNKSGELWPHPVRVQPGKKLLGNKHVIDYLSKITTEEVKKWNRPLVFCDAKLKGVRGILVIDLPNRDVKILSRTGDDKTYKKFVEKYKDKILDGIDWDKVTGDLILDSEVYTVDKETKGPVYQGIATGSVRNPDRHKGVEHKIVVFDALMVNQKDIRKLPLKDRKKLVDAVIDGEGGMLEEALTALVPPEKIRDEFIKAIKKRYEGLVIKDPEQEYISEKGPPLRWIKLKAMDTLDLEVKAAEKWPYGKDKPFKFYKHWRLVPSDNDEHEVKADKGIRFSGLNFKFYEDFTKHLIDLWKRGIAKGEGGMVKVDPKYQEVYGVKKVPCRIVIPKDYRIIAEIQVEDMTKNLKPSGVKIVGIREDKKPGHADTIKDMENVRKLFFGK